VTVTSVFEKYESKAYPIAFAGTIQTISPIAGGIPTDEKVAEGWLRTKLAPKDDLIQAAVAETMAERGVTADEATKIVDATKHLNGFKRDDQGLYIEGRQLKAALKEAVSVAVAAGKIQQQGWGNTKKWITKYFPEHVFVVEDRLHLGVTEPTGIVQRFVHTFRGTGIQYEEYIEDATFDFTIETDHEFSDEEWAMIWLTGGNQGIGASRSQGFGRYVVTKWDRIR